MEEKKKSNVMKWIGLIIIIAILALVSIIISGIISIAFGISNISDDNEDFNDVKGSNVALIEIKGIITSEDESSAFGASTGVSSSEIISSIEKIKKDNSIKAVIFEINSPGGSGVAADEIATAISSLNITKVAYIKEIGTSAAYWIASSADVVYANKMSLVGSIGVIASYVEFSGFLTRYNMTYQRFVAGENKDFGSPFRKPTQMERDKFNKQLEELHGYFIEAVANNRKLDVEDVRKLADGSIFTTKEAIDSKLIDGIGGKNEAIAYVEKNINATAVIKKIEKKKTIFDIIGLSAKQSSYNVGRGIGDSIKADSMQSISIS